MLNHCRLTLTYPTPDSGLTHTYIKQLNSHNGSAMMITAFAFNTIITETALNHFMHNRFEKNKN